MIRLLPAIQAKGGSHELGHSHKRGSSFRSRRGELVSRQAPRRTIWHFGGMPSSAESAVQLAVQARVPADEAAGCAAEAEELGFSRFLLPDHPGNTADPFVGLAAAASSTSRIGLGTYVLNVGIRQPWQVASAAASLHALSNGRFSLGLGAGHTPSEWRLTGCDLPSPGERVARLEEFLVITQRLLAGEVVVFSGEHFQLDGARLEKALLGPSTIPIIVGGNGARVMRLGGRSADVVSVTGFGRTLADGHGHSVRWGQAEVEATIRGVRAAAIGRERAPLVEVLVQHLELTDDRLTAARRFVADDVSGLGLETALDTPFVFFGNAAEVAQQMQSWQQRLGIGSYVVRSDVMRDAARVSYAFG